MKAELKEKSKILATVWVVYSLLELLPSPRRNQSAVVRSILLLLRVVKRLFLSIIMIANVFMTLSFIESKEQE